MLNYSKHYGFNQSEAKSTSGKNIYSYFFHQASEGFALIDVNTKRIIEGNRAFAKMLGYEPEQLNDMSLYDLIYESKKSIDSYYGNLFSLHSCAPTELCRYRKSDGSVLEMERTGLLINNNGNKVFAVSVRPVPNYRVPEAQAIKYRLISENSRDIMLLIGLNGQIIEVNRAACEEYGYTKEEFLSLNVKNLRPPATYAELSDQAQQACEKGILLETFHIRKDGSAFPVEVSSCGTVIMGQPVFLSIIRNITERKAAEDAAKKTAKMLETIIDILPDRFFLKNTAGVYEMVNMAFERDFQMPRANILGKRAIDLFPPGLAMQCRNSDNEVLAKKITLDAEEEVTNNGVKRYFQTVKVPVFGNDGDPIGIIGVSRDITNIKQAKNELKKRLAQLQLSWEQTIEVLATAYEMKDPYTYGHQKRVAKLAEAIAGEMGLNDHDTIGIRMAAMVHDIGKLNIPGELLSKPGKLTGMEFEYIKTHTTAGYEILKNLQLPWQIGDIVYQHHERVNGSGYPNGLTGQEIHIGAKIIGVADVVEAMASHRPYRPSRGVEKALEEIEQNRGTLYDPTVVDACVKLFTAANFSLGG